MCMQARRATRAGAEAMAMAPLPQRWQGRCRRARQRPTPHPAPCAGRNNYRKSLCNPNVRDSAMLLRPCEMTDRDRQVVMMTLLLFAQLPPAQSVLLTSSSAGRMECRHQVTIIRGRLTSEPACPSVWCRTQHCSNPEPIPVTPAHRRAHPIATTGLQQAKNQSILPSAQIPCRGFPTGSHRRLCPSPKPPSRAHAGLLPFSCSVGTQKLVSRG